MDSRKVLVIDDDPLVLRTISQILHGRGYESRTAHSEDKALEYAEQEHFSVVLSDIRMPRTNGISAAQKIEAIYRERQKACRFIFLTGFAAEGDSPLQSERGLSPCKTVGVADLMMKPFDARRLIHAIESELELMREKRHQIAA